MVNATFGEEEFQNEQIKSIDDFMKESREEERKERIIHILDTRTIELLNILATIAKAISRHPK